MRLTVGPSVMLILQLLGIAIFLFGFFPTKIPMSGSSSFKDLANVGTCNISQIWSKRRVGQVVLIVIDALRVDFVLPNKKLSSFGLNLVDSRPKIDYISTLMQEGRHAVAYVAQAHAPTVTLPRIKALVTGTIPGFVDVVLNFGSSILNEDNLIGQLTSDKRGSDMWTLDKWSINFFGDDTWIKLFPGHFKEEEGTTSFFVADFTEVDQNVTRHLTDAYLHRTDWDMTILHYLGLDHIGHLAGPSSPYVRPKLDEMGAIIQKVKEALFKKHARERGLPPLILILGDHGMADVGGHGGASPAEVLVPLVAISPDINRDRDKRGFELLIKQPDLVPTLARLTASPIPKNNLGILIESLVQPFVSTRSDSSSCNEMVANFYYNSLQVSKSLEANFASFHSDEGYIEFLSAKKLIESNSTEIDQILKVLRSSLMKMAHTLEDNLLHYKISYMFLGMAIILMTVLLLFSWFWGQICSISSLLNCSLIFHLGHILSLASTSFIEEEHQTAYFLAISINLLILYQLLCKQVNLDMKQANSFQSHDQYLQNAYPNQNHTDEDLKQANLVVIQPNSKSIKSDIFKCLVLMGILKIARCWNQTGDKWGHLPDISDWLLMPENRFELSFLHLSSLLLTWILNVTQKSRQRHLFSVFTAWSIFYWSTILALVYLQKVSDGSVVNVFSQFGTIPVKRIFWPSQLIYSLGLLHFLAQLLFVPISLDFGLYESLLPIFILLAQPQSTIILPIGLLVYWIVSDLLEVVNPVKGFGSTSIYMIFGMASYFQMGNSNSLSSVDVGAGYNGVSSFNPVIIGLLMSLNTYSGQILWMLLPLQKLKFTSYANFIELNNCLKTFAFYRGCELLFFTFVCLVSRYHLFVWTVFSPKLLYEGMQTAVLTSSVIFINLIQVLLHLKLKIEKKVFCQFQNVERVGQ